MDMFVIIIGLLAYIIGAIPVGYLIASAAQSLVGAEATLFAGACIVLAATAIVVPLSAIRGIRSNERPRPMALTPATSDRTA